jgi:hypothetical protein
VAESRRYQLQNDAANRLIAQLVEVAGVPPDRRGYIQQMLTTVLKLHEDGAQSGDLRITNTALKEQIFRELLTFMMADARTIPRSIRLILISRFLERVADHATNIAEMVIYMVDSKMVRHTLA